MNDYGISSGKIQKQQTMLELLMKILSERERWKFEAIRIIKSTDLPISSFKVTQRLNKSGLKTSISSVHSFFDILVESDLCYRNREWKRVRSKKVEITNIGKEFCNSLNIKIGNGTTNNQ